MQNKFIKNCYQKKYGLFLSASVTRGMKGWSRLGEINSVAIAAEYNGEMVPPGRDKLHGECC